MTTYKQITNPNTGQREFLFNGKLLKIGENVMQNSNSKDYKIVTLGFQLPDGEKVQRTAICYASNYEYGIEEGKDYLCNLSFDEQGEPQITMSHLNNANRASINDFAGLFQVTKQLIDDEVVM
ncbi:hypothetical protein [uncultured Polaribacter sp.]|uniref:hypothetical protein n=1 Tax=uncultured Polaribacter sp. TaxID=174711 RepID=UPI00261B7D25|nr:hypothetical protein [uncultured Polaribacter sp.]